MSFGVHFIILYPVSYIFFNLGNVYTLISFSFVVLLISIMSLFVKDIFLVFDKDPVFNIEIHLNNVYIVMPSDLCISKVVSTDSGYERTDEDVLIVYTVFGTPDSISDNENYHIRN